MSEEFSIPQNGLIDFYADWCPPCKQMDPILKELKEEGFEIHKVNVEEETLMAQYFDIVNIPTFVLMEEGKEQVRLIGAVHKDKLRQQLVKLKNDD